MLKDKGVLALIKKKVAEQEGKKLDQRWDMKEIVTYVSLFLCAIAYLCAIAVQ